MAQNPATYYGLDVACVSDADELFSEAEGVQVIFQDAVHRLTVQSVLGPGGDDWGFDCRKLIGMKQKDLTRMQPTLIEVLTRDDRILTADVTLTETKTNGLIDAEIAVHCETDEGPFDFTSPISSITTASLEAIQ